MLNLDKRQKVILVLIIFALLILTWQVYRIGFATGANPSIVKSAENPVIAEARASTNQTVTPETSTPPGDNAMVGHQQKYLALVNQYQLYEIQRMIAEDQAAIAESRYNAAIALAKLSRMAGAETRLNNLIDVYDQSSPVNSDELIYADEDQGQWIATVKKNDQIVDVTVGSDLPDHSKVIDIDTQGVVIQEGRHQERLTFNGVMPITATEKPLLVAPQSDTAISTSDTKSDAATNLKTKAEVTFVNPSNTTATSSAESLPAQASATEHEQTVQAVTDAKKGSALSDASLPAKHVNDSASNAETTPVSNTSEEKQAAADFIHAAKNHYTVQMIADTDQTVVNQFVSQHQLQDKAVVLETTRKGKPWYIAVLGQYDTAAEAAKAITTLPKQLRIEGPFVRRIGNIQSNMVNQDVN